MKKKIYIESIVLIFLGSFSSLSLPPFNFILINFLTFSLFYILLIKTFKANKKIKFSKNMYLGDIIISYNYLNKPKSQDLELFKQKTIKIFIHGFLHLLGFNHVKNKDYFKMLREENFIYKHIKSKIN